MNDRKKTVMYNAWWRREMVVTGEEEKKRN